MAVVELRAGPQVSDLPEQIEVPTAAVIEAVGHLYAASEIHAAVTGETGAGWQWCRDAGAALLDAAFGVSERTEGEEYWRHPAVLLADARGNELAAEALFSITESARRLQSEANQIRQSGVHPVVDLYAEQPRTVAEVDVLESAAAGLERVGDSLEAVVESRRK